MLLRTAEELLLIDYEILLAAIKALGNPSLLPRKRRVLMNEGLDKW